MRKLILLTICILFMTLSMDAQDARLSQIWSFPTMMNPAFAGHFDEGGNAGVGYSGQSSKYGSTAHQYAFYNAKIKDNRSIKERSYGLGASYYQYGNASNTVITPISAKFFAITGAYHFNLSSDGSHKLGVGTQMVFASATANERGGVYDKEINGGGFRWTDMQPGGTRSNVANYVDMNSGVYYDYFADNIDVEIGVGGYHYLHPKNSLITLDKDTRLRGRLNIQGKMNIYLNPYKKLTLSNVFWHEGLYWNSTVLDKYILVTNWSGIELSKIEPQDRKITFDYGLFTRSFKTILPVIKLNSGTGVDVRLSYEFPIASTPYDSYTARRTEMSIHIKLFGKKEGALNKPMDMRIGGTGSGGQGVTPGRKYVPKPVIDTTGKGAVAAVNSNDKDGDGIANNIDKCPDQAGPLNNYGCPINDRDGDGVLDLLDQCPDEYGSPYNNGCPNFRNTMDANSNFNPNMNPIFRNPEVNSNINANQEEYSALINKNSKKLDTLQYYVFFDAYSISLTQNSFSMLNKVVDFMKKNKEYKCILSGHGDQEGSDQANMTVSESRAKVVKSYLLSYGIEPIRLTTYFFGKTQPLPVFEKNLLWMNRRVEVLLIKVS